MKEGDRDEFPMPNGAVERITVFLDFLSRRPAAPYYLSRIRYVLAAPIPLKMKANCW
jgi:hypothetical protein